MPLPRRHARDPRFTFGTGKLGDLAGFASAVLLALIALLIGWESFQRFLAPVDIDFAQAIIVAVVGLAVNLASAWLLRDDHDHHGHAHHNHAHAHHDHHGHAHHDHAHAGHDNNLRAAYLHVLADALTSVLAIAALALGSLFGWVWLDAVMGIVGALIIARWSWGLIRDAGGVLLDFAGAQVRIAGRDPRGDRNAGNRDHGPACLAAGTRPSRCHHLAAVPTRRSRLPPIATGWRIFMACPI